jgi:hypothetical protein
MLACLLCFLLLDASPFYAPTRPAIITASGPLTGIDLRTRTLRMRCDGRERLFVLPEDTKITINGKPNRTLLDFRKIWMDSKPRVRITIIHDEIEMVELVVMHD